MTWSDSIAGTRISVRIPEDIADEVATVARVEGKNISEVVRAGLYGHLSHLREDPNYQQRLRKRLEKDREILERYIPEGGGG